MGVNKDLIDITQDASVMIGPLGYFRLELTTILKLSSLLLDNVMT
jgi:hypothetical protein